MKHLFCLVIAVLCLTTLRAQSHSTDYQDLLFYSDIMMNADSESHRLRANDKFHKLFVEVLEKPNSFKIPLESIPYITGKMAPDSSFKLLTFHYSEDSGKTKDFGYIQQKNSRYTTLKAETNLDDVEYEQLTDGRWVSGLYFHMIPFDRNGKKYYVLFGYSQPTEFEKRKVIDVLHFEDGKPIFGDEIFIEKQIDARDIRRTRRMYFYAADAVMSIRDDKDFGAIVVDHLMEVRSRMPGYKANVFVPDGTYTAYFLEKGEWIYKDKLFEENDVNSTKDKPEAEVKRDIFGKGNK